MTAFFSMGDRRCVVETSWGTEAEAREWAEWLAAEAPAEFAVTNSGCDAPPYIYVTVHSDEFQQQIYDELLRRGHHELEYEPERISGPFGS